MFRIFIRSGKLNRKKTNKLYKHSDGTIFEEFQISFSRKPIWIQIEDKTSLVKCSHIQKKTIYYFQSAPFQRKSFNIEYNTISLEHLEIIQQNRREADFQYLTVS